MIQLRQKSETSWQIKCPGYEFLKIGDRFWQTLPNYDQCDWDYVSKMACHVLRHMGIHGSDGGVTFPRFMEKLTELVWNQIGETECQLLCGSLADCPRFQICRRIGKRPPFDLMTPQCLDNEYFPAYIRAVSGRSGNKIRVLSVNDAVWNILASRCPICGILVTSMTSTRFFGMDCFAEDQIAARKVGASIATSVSSTLASAHGNLGQKRKEMNRSAISPSSPTHLPSAWTPSA